MVKYHFIETYGIIREGDNQSLYEKFTVLRDGKEIGTSIIEWIAMIDLYNAIFADPEGIPDIVFVEQRIDYSLIYGMLPGACSTIKDK